MGDVPSSFGGMEFLFYQLAWNRSTRCCEPDPTFA